MNIPMTIKEFESIVKKNKASASPGFHGGSNRYSRMHHPTSREPARPQERTAENTQLSLLSQRGLKTGAWSQQDDQTTFRPTAWTMIHKFYANHK